LFIAPRSSSIVFNVNKFAVKIDIKDNFMTGFMEDGFEHRLPSDTTGIGTAPIR